MALRTMEGQLEELSRAGKQALKSQPFSALIGARLTSLSEGKAVLEVPIRAEKPGWRRPLLARAGPPVGFTAHAIPRKVGL